MLTEFILEFLSQIFNFAFVIEQGNGKGKQSPMSAMGRGPNRGADFRLPNANKEILNSRVNFTQNFNQKSEHIRYLNV